MRIIRLVAAASLSALFLTGSVGVAEALKKGQSPQSCEAKHDACEVGVGTAIPGTWHKSLPASSGLVTANAKTAGRARLRSSRTKSRFSLGSLL